MIRGWWVPHLQSEIKNRRSSIVNEALRGKKPMQGRILWNFALAGEVGGSASPP
jgi:hypothetical protein